MTKGEARRLLRSMLVNGTDCDIEIDETPGAASFVVRLPPRYPQTVLTVHQVCLSALAEHRPVGVIWSLRTMCKGGQQASRQGDVP